jgi:hypothetical protein
MRPEVAEGVKAGWLTFPTEPAERKMARTAAQPAEAFDIGLVYRMWDNGADRATIARAVGCKLRGIDDLINIAKEAR